MAYRRRSPGQSRDWRPSMRTRTSDVTREVLLTAACAALVLIAARPARAANDLCGQTITQSVVLTDNEICSGDGIIVGADGLTIDLNGFTIGGAGGTDDIGIEVAGHSKIVIKNG